MPSDGARRERVSIAFRLKEWHGAAGVAALAEQYAAESQSPFG